MAVGRVELEIPEMQALVERLSGVRRGEVLWRARRELQRGLERALEAQRAEKANMARIRREREERYAERGEIIHTRRAR